MGQKIKLDDNEYEVENLSDQAKITLASLQFATTRMQELKRIQAQPTGSEVAAAEPQPPPSKLPAGMSVRPAPPPPPSPHASATADALAAKQAAGYTLTDAELALLMKPPPQQEVASLQTTEAPD